MESANAPAIYYAAQSPDRRDVFAVRGMLFVVAGQFRGQERKGYHYPLDPRCRTEDGRLNEMYLVALPPS